MSSRNSRSSPSRRLSDLEAAVTRLSENYYLDAPRKKNLLRRRARAAVGAGLVAASGFFGFTHWERLPEPVRIPMENLVREAAARRETMNRLVILPSELGGESMILMPSRWSSDAQEDAKAFQLVYALADRFSQVSGRPFDSLPAESRQRLTERIIADLSLVQAINILERDPEHVDHTVVGLIEFAAGLRGSVTSDSGQEPALSAKLGDRSVLAAWSLLGGSLHDERG
jgi:hypothetical protein